MCPVVRGGCPDTCPVNAAGVAGSSEVSIVGRVPAEPGQRPCDVALKGGQSGDGGIRATCYEKLWCSQGTIQVPQEVSPDLLPAQRGASASPGEGPHPLEPAHVVTPEAAMEDEVQPFLVPIAERMRDMALLPDASLATCPFLQAFRTGAQMDDNEYDAVGEETCYLCGVPCDEEMCSSCMGSLQEEATVDAFVQSAEDECCLCGVPCREEICGLCMDALQDEEPPGDDFGVFGGRVGAR